MMEWILKLRFAWIRIIHFSYHDIVRNILVPNPEKLIRYYDYILPRIFRYRNDIIDIFVLYILLIFLSSFAIMALGGKPYVNRFQVIQFFIL